MRGDNAPSLPRTDLSNNGHILLSHSDSINRIGRVRKAALSLALTDPPSKFAVRVIKAAFFLQFRDFSFKSIAYQEDFGNCLVSAVTIVFMRTVKLTIVLNDNFCMVFLRHKALVLFRHTERQEAREKARLFS